MFAKRKHFLRKNRKPYTDPGTDYLEIMTRRNAPRWIRMMKDYGIEQPATGQVVTGRGLSEGRKFFMPNYCVFKNLSEFNCLLTPPVAETVSFWRSCMSAANQKR